MPKHKADGKPLGHCPEITIPVTQKHIDGGVARDSGHCMFAEAVKDAVPGAKFVSVDLQTIRWTDSTRSERYVALTPRKMQQAIVDFDRGVKPKPFRVRAGRGGQVLPSGQGVKKQRKATLRKVSGGSGRNVPERVGGKAPPRYPALRRGFGVRGLRY